VHQFRIMAARERIGRARIGCEEGRGEGRSGHYSNTGRHSVFFIRGNRAFAV
jgi:hypothetical protein